MIRVSGRLSGLLIWLSLIVVLFTWDVNGNGSEEQARNIVKKMDEMYRSDSSFAKLEMEIVTPHWKRTLKIDFWSLGKTHTFIRILEPKKERGMATLRIDKEMWNYFPKTNKIIKIPPSMMMGSWMGSDFTNDDLVKEYNYIDDYRFTIIHPDDGKGGIIYVKCIPKPNVPIVWGYVILEVRSSDYMPVRQNYYDEKGTLKREMIFSEIRKMGNKIIPTVMELIPTQKKGKKTVIRYLQARFNANIGKKIFSLRNLRTGI